MTNFRIILYFLFFIMLACSKNAGKKNKILKDDSLELAGSQDPSAISSKNKLIELAQSNYDNNRYKEAESIYNKLIEVDSTNGDFYYKRGFSRAQLSKYSESTQDYLKAVNLNRRIEDSYFNIACNYGALNIDSTAILYLKKTLKINPKNEKAQGLLNTYLKHNELLPLRLMDSIINSSNAKQGKMPSFKTTLPNHT